MKIVATIEARMTSTRLPKKVLMEIEGRSILYLIVERLKQIESIDEIVLATTTNDTDDVLVEFAKSAEINCFRGSEDDVMGRVLGAAESVNADVVVEICGDCPLIDPNLIDQLIEIYKSNNVDYVANNLVRSYPIGMDTQVFNVSSLKKSYEMTDHPLDREHVTRHIRNNPDIFKQLSVVAPKNIRYPDFSVTLDETKDFELISKIVKYFNSHNKPVFSCLEMIEAMKENSDWGEINKDVRRKGYDS
jgi:spore coat polysaccharide biosynthesis protein SpsF